MAVHGTVPQPGRAGGSGAGDGRSLQRPQRRAESTGQGTLCRPGVVQAGQYVRHDHVHRPLCRKSERTGKEAALPQGAEADLSAPDAPAADAPSPQRWRLCGGGFRHRRPGPWHQQRSGKPDPGAAESRHQPVSGFCHEPHRQHPPLGHGGKGGRPVVSGLLPPLRGPHHPRPVRADGASGVPQHRTRQLYMV